MYMMKTAAVMCTYIKKSQTLLCQDKVQEFRCNHKATDFAKASRFKPEFGLNVIC